MFNSAIFPLSLFPLHIPYIMPRVTDDDLIRIIRGELPLGNTLFQQSSSSLEHKEGELACKTSHGTQSRKEDNNCDSDSSEYSDYSDDDSSSDSESDVCISPKREIKKAEQPKILETEKKKTNTDIRRLGIKCIKGVGPVNEKKLNSKGYKTISQLLGKFLVMNSDSSEFKKYMREECGINAANASKISESIDLFCSVMFETEYPLEKVEKCFKLCVAPGQ